MKNFHKSGYLRDLQQNSEIKKAKRKYFTYNLELSKSNPKKAWHLINELSSRHSNKVGNTYLIKTTTTTTTTFIRTIQEE